MRILLFVVMFFALSGCLKTRSEVKDTDQRSSMQQQVVSLQKNNADTSNRFSEIEEQVRELTGRVDVVENRQLSGSHDSDKEKRSIQEQQLELNRKLSLLQESVIKMETQIVQLSAEMAAGKEKPPVTAANTSKKSSFELGEDSFQQKDWKKAIINYEKYRQDNPKGKNFGEATYKIGVSFQELKMKDEARTFYEEVISKYPNSDDARRSRQRLKSLKK